MSELAQALAEALDGPCYTLSDLRAETLYSAVRDEMGKAGKLLEGKK